MRRRAGPKVGARQDVRPCIRAARQLT